MICFVLKEEKAIFNTCSHLRVGEWEDEVLYNLAELWKCHGTATVAVKRVESLQRDAIYNTDPK